MTEFRQLKVFTIRTKTEWKAVEEFWSHKPKIIVVQLLMLLDVPNILDEDKGLLMKI